VKIKHFWGLKVEKNLEKPKRIVCIFIRIKNMFNPNKIFNSTSLESFG